MRASVNDTGPLRANKRAQWNTGESRRISPVVVPDPATGTLREPVWLQPPPVTSVALPAFAAPALGSGLVEGLGAKEFMAEFQNQLDDRQLAERDVRLFHTGLEVVTQAMSETGRRPFSSIEDLMDVLAASINHEFGTHHPTTDEVQGQLPSASSKPVSANHLFKALAVVSAAQMLIRFPGAAEAATSTATAVSRDATRPLYENVAAWTDAIQCAQGGSTSPCTYPEDPRTLSREVIFLNEMAHSGKVFEPLAVYIVVERPDGKIYAVPQANQLNLRHANLAGGHSLPFSGAFGTDQKGGIDLVTNQSGHFLPGPTPYIDPKDCSVHRRDHYNPILPFIKRLKELGVPMSTVVRWGAVKEQDEGFKIALGNCWERLRLSTILNEEL